MKGSINMFVKKIVRAVLAAVMVVAFCGCDLWMNDWKGYLEYWSEAVTMGRVEVSGATFQTNADGVQTLPLDATAKISGYVINPQGYALVGNSIEINEPTLANSATKNVADPTLISVLLENVASQGITEHTTFTVTFAPVRADNGIASTETMSVTLQYNTPPAAPLRMNSDGNGGFEVVQTGGLWKADSNGNLYWKWPYTTTSNTEPNAVKWFSIDGVLYELSECEVPNNSGIYSKNTGNKSVKLAAVDSEGISGSSITSGVTVPAGEVIVYQITFNDDGGSGSNTPITVVYGQELPPVTSPSRTGHTFGGYFTAQNGGGTQYYDGNGAGVKPWAEFSDATLYAYWTANSYTINFDRDGGSGGSDSISVTYGGAPSSITPPSRTGHTFGGYFTAQNGGGTLYYDGNGAGVKPWAEFSNATLYAYWTANRYTINFDRDGGSGGSDSISVTYGGAPSSITPPSRRGHTFEGYYTEKNGGGDKYFNADGSYAKGTWKETQNVTLYAQWKIMKITLDASKINFANDLRNELAKYSGCEITVDLNGKNLSVDYNDFTQYSEFFTVKDGTKVTITGGAIKMEGNFSSSENFSLFSVDGKDSSLTLSGCTLLGVDFGNASMTAVKVSSGSVNLINTTISDIVSNGSGAGVSVYNNGSVTMKGGAIRNNSARYGAAVHFMYGNGTFTMEGGDISNNTCINGSVISFSNGSSGRFVWNGGTISGNKNGTADGGGVFASKIEYDGTKNKYDAS